MRPVGALLFGLLADRYGRRIPLMANVIYFSIIEVLCGFSPNFTVFIFLRALFGIGMGGEWGVGASLAMEARRVRWRGILSGILQSGYSIGYLLAAMAARFLLPVVGVASHVLDRRAARATRALHPDESAGIRGVEAAPRCEHRASFAYRGGRVEALRLSRCAHDLHDVPVSWNAGSLSGLSERSAQDFQRNGSQYRDDL